VGFRAGLDAGMRRKIPSPYRDSNPHILMLNLINSERKTYLTKMKGNDNYIFIMEYHCTLRRKCIFARIPIDTEYSEMNIFRQKLCDENI
jgi:hypothetical protein